MLSNVRLSSHVVVIALVAALTPAASPEAAAWPERTVRIITGAAGTSPDAVSRTLADALAKRWKQSVVVDNRPGADHILAVQGMVEARDGHTLLFTTHSSFTVNPLLHEQLPYDPIRDALPISLAVDDFLGVVVAPSVPVSSLAELVALARSKQRELNAYAVPGSPHLAYLAFERRAGIQSTFVPYRSPPSALTDLTQGRIQIGVMPLAIVRGQVQAGNAKVLAVTNAQRSPAFPQVPTVAEAGFPDFTFGGLLGLFGPKDMATALRERIAADVQDILRDPEVQRRLTNLGIATRGTTPAEFAIILDEQRAKWSAIARAHGIKPARRATQ